MSSPQSPAAYRRLAPDDTEHFRALMAVFADAFEDRDTYLGAPPDDDYVRTLVGRPHVIVLVATAQNEVVGGLVAYELEKFERARSEIYIYDLAVAERFRRRGIARGLITKLQGVAAERGAWVIFVQGDPGDTPALALYDSMGRREDVHHFDIPVPPRGN